MQSALTPIRLPIYRSFPLFSCLTADLDIAFISNLSRVELLVPSSAELLPSLKIGLIYQGKNILLYHMF